MTLGMDDAVLDQVMAATGAKTMTLAIELALREIDRRTMLSKVASECFGLTAAELKETVNPA